MMNVRSSWPGILLVAAALCGGCEGQVGGGPGGGAPGENNPVSAGGSAGNGGGAVGVGTGTGGAACTLSAGSRTVRRLSQREYLNVVTDLLGTQFAAAAAPMFPFEPRVAGFDNQDSALLVSAAFQGALSDVADKLSGVVDATTLAPCATPTASTGCLSTFAQGFARKAFGRSPTSTELQNLLALGAHGTSYANSVQLIVDEILQSPQMLYVSELGPDAPKSGAMTTLTQQEIASQISFMFAGARPDEQLLQAADQGHLASTADIKTQVSRLIATPRGTQQLRLLVNGWLDMGPVSEAPKDTLAFPAFTPDLVAAMQEEFDAFVDTNVASGQGTLSTLMSATSAHIPAGLVSLYGTELTGPQTLDPTHRKGILSLPGLLTYHSADTHSGPIDRGLMVRRQLLCTALAPPPASVVAQLAANPINTMDKTRTTRMVYEQHKNMAGPSAPCAACHSLFDVIGFGMEEMDGLGRYRTTENGLPIDTSGQLNGTDVKTASFSGVSDLDAKLAGSQNFAGCFVQQFFRFAETRTPLPADQCTVTTWANAFHAGGEHINDLIASYISDPGFATRQEDR